MADLYKGGKFASHKNKNLTSKNIKMKTAIALLIAAFAATTEAVHLARPEWEGWLETGNGKPEWENADEPGFRWNWMGMNPKAVENQNSNAVKDEYASPEAALGDDGDDGDDGEASAGEESEHENNGKRHAYAWGEGGRHGDDM